MPLAHLLDQEEAGVPEFRYIFHIGFCGSTLLTRLLDARKQTLVLREPNCLADLANAKTHAARQGHDHPLLPQAVAAASRHLARPWTAGEPVIVKPSNWANNLLLELVRQRGTRALFLMSSRQQFLEAVLRGGPNRLAFAARAAVHLSNDHMEHATLVAAALHADDDQSGRLARLAVVLHAIQLDQFKAAAALAGWGEGDRLDYSDLVADPVAAVLRAVKALDLDIGQEAIAANVARWMARDAKEPDSSFSSDQNAKWAAALRSQHGATMDRALNWAEQCL